MALDYVKTSKDILEAVGGKENVVSATHCMTRLRLVLKNESKADDKKVEAIRGVKSIIKQGGQYQVVIGNEVSNLFKEFEKLGNFSEDGGAEAVKPTGNPIQRVFGFVAGCMTPLLPAMLGTGMVKVLLTLLTTFGVMSDQNPTYVIFYGMADSFFYFLPLFLAVTIAKKMRGSIPLFMVIGAMFCYPDIVSLLANGMEGYELGTFIGMPCTYLFGVIPVVQATYTSSVIPILLMAPVMKWVEDFADRVSPNVLKAFLKPMIFCLICTPIALCILGPIGAIVGNGMASVFSAMYNAVPWLTVAILSAAMPFIVMTGMHYALIPLCMNNLATLGYDVIVMVTMFASNIAQGGAAFGVAAKTKDTDIRSEGIACGISATVAGVTEPAMYGINLRFGKPMVGAVIGAGLSGLFLGLTGVKGFTMGGSPSFLTVITFIGGDVNPMRGLYLGLLGGAISAVVAFLISMFLYKDEEKKADVPNTEAAAEEKKPLVEKIEVASPMKGEVVKLSAVPDQVFASGALGDGVAIIPEDGKVYAPFDGVVTAVMDTGHAIGITGDNGVDILIHVGLDTVNLEGAPFKYAVKDGEKIKKGQLVLTADLDMIRAKNCQTYTPVIITNTDDYVSVKQGSDHQVKVGDLLMTIV